MSEWRVASILRKERQRIEDIPSNSNSNSELHYTWMQVIRIENKQAKRMQLELTNGYRRNHLENVAEEEDQRT